MTGHAGGPVDGGGRDGNSSDPGGGGTGGGGEGGGGGAPGDDSGHTPGHSPGHSYRRRPSQYGPAEYRIEDLARHGGATVRTIRAYQDRGLLPRPGRRGRANVYDDSHLTRLRQISALLERGYTLASIRELLAAWDEGRGLSGVLDLVAEVEGPWTDEEPGRLTRAELDGLFGGAAARGDDAVAEAVELGVLDPLPDRPGEYLVPSPQELAVAAELHRAGVPLLALTGHLRELRTQVEHIAASFMEFTGEHVFGRCRRTGPTDEEAAEAAGLVRRLRPLAKQTVEAELARAMRTFASRSLRERLRRPVEERPEAGRTAEGRKEAPAWSGHPAVTGTGAEPETPTGVPEGPEPAAGPATGPESAATGAGPATAAEPAPASEPEPAVECASEPEPAAPATGPEPAVEPATEPAATAAEPAPGPAAGPATVPEAGEPLRLPVRVLAAVRDLVGAEQTAAFVAAAAEREVQARTMDRLAGGGRAPSVRSPDSP